MGEVALRLPCVVPGAVALPLDEILVFGGISVDARVDDSLNLPFIIMNGSIALAGPTTSTGAF